MVYLFYGSDRDHLLAEFGKMVLAYTQAGATIIRIHGLEFDALAVEEYLTAQSLLGGDVVVVTNGLLENKNAREYVREHIDRIAASQAVFLFLEGTLLPADQKIFETVAKKIFHHNTHLAQGPRFDIFRIPNALGRRNRKELWVLFEQAHINGITTEEIFWQCVRQVKTMLLVSTTGLSAEKLGMNPNHYHYAFVAARNYSHQELRSLSRSLVSMYHDTRRSSTDLRILLERFIFSL